MQQQGLDPSFAEQRVAWQSKEDLWVAQWLPALPVPLLEARHNVRQVDVGHWDVWDKRAMQGLVHGSACVFLVQGRDELCWQLLHLHRSEGWQSWPFCLHAYNGPRDLVHAALSSIPAHVFNPWVFIRMYFLHSSVRLSADFPRVVSYREDLLVAKRTPAVLFFTKQCPETWQPIVMEAAQSAT